LDVQKMISSAEEAIGWPYDSPGSNDAHGIDCSGLFVKMYKDQGRTIYHGSNTIFHNHCNQTEVLTKVSQLQPGMAVFKLKKWTGNDVGNKWYGKQPGNLSHIGFVASINPLKIIHASSEAKRVTIDSRINSWSYWGKLKDVDYGGDNMSEVTEKTETNETYATAVVFADTGSSVKMRAKPSTSCSTYYDIPIGTEVEVLNSDEDWSKIKARGREGYMMTKFLQASEAANASTLPGEETITVSKNELNQVYVKLEKALGQLFVDKKNLENAYDIIGDMLGLRG